MNVIDRWFRLEEINGNYRCPTYLYRWTLFQPKWGRWFWRGFGIYIHQFVGDDWSLDLHDHPKRFISIGLWGSYIEWTPAKITTYDIYLDANGDEIVRSEERLFALDAASGRTFRAPWFRTFPAEHIHRITLCADRRPCWTLVIVLRAVREWGFWHAGQWIPWKDYVRGSSSAIADKMRACL